MTITDAQIASAAAWVVAALTGSIVTLFKMAITNSRKIGKLEEEVETYKECPVPNCYFRRRTLTETTTSNT